MEVRQTKENPSHQISNYQKTTQRASFIGIVGNIVLAGFKLAAGFIGKSEAMVSDAVHSLSDVAGGIIVIIGVGLSEKEADKEHPYGHERIECIASIFLAVILLFAGGSIAITSAKKIVTMEYLDAELPGMIALVAAIVSIVSKEAMFQYTMHTANKNGSGALRAEAWHHRSDALSSVGSLIGIAGARMGFPALDPLAGCLISLFIRKAAFDIFNEAMEKMVDHSCSEEMEQQIRECVSKYPYVLGIDLLHTREFGRKVYVDLEVKMEGKESLALAHSHAEEIHDSLEQNFPQIKHVMVHVNPA